MLISKITAKGQTTIPLEVRELLGLKAGDRIRFVPMDGKVEIVPRNKPASSLFGMLEPYAISGTRLDDYRSAVGASFSDDGAGDHDEKAA
ncbi:MAG: AbrB/MazE/SpoVT family DNA-binding domain-containing protein [Pseudomonadota bacterium]